MKTLIAHTDAEARGFRDETIRLRVEPIEPQPPEGYRFYEYVYDPTLSARFQNYTKPLGMWTKRAPFAPEEIVGVKEAWACGTDNPTQDSVTVWYRADPKTYAERTFSTDAMGPKGHHILRSAERWEVKSLPHYHHTWQPAKLMPQWAIRTRLRIVSVEARLAQSITEEEAKACGVYECDDGDTYCVHCCQRVSRMGPWQDICPCGEPLPEYGPSYKWPFAEQWDRRHPKHPWDRNGWAWMTRFKLEGQ